MAFFSELFVVVVEWVDRPKQQPKWHSCEREERNEVQDHIFVLKICNLIYFTYSTLFVFLFISQQFLPLHFSFWNPHTKNTVVIAFCCFSYQILIFLGNFFCALLVCLVQIFFLWIHIKHNENKPGFDSCCDLTTNKN